MLSIIYMFFSYSHAWQLKAQLKIHTKQEMQSYQKVARLYADCLNKTDYLLFPRVCEDWIASAEGNGYIDETTAKVERLRIEKKCAERVLEDHSLQKWMSWSKQVAGSSNCKKRIDEKIKDLIYQESI